MRVLYDITTLANIYFAKDARPTGIFRHTEAMGLALANIPGIDLYLTCIPSQLGKAARYIRATNKFRTQSLLVSPALRLGTEPNIHAEAYTQSLVQDSPSAFTSAYYESVFSPESICCSNGIDIYHVNWRGATQIARDIPSRTVLTVYDLIALKRPEWFVNRGEANPIGDYLNKLLLSVSARDAVTVSSVAVKLDILEMFQNISASQIFVVPLGVSPNFQPIEDADKIAAVCKKYKLPGGARYLLSVNTFEPRKNLERTILAYVSLINEGLISDVYLVLAGGKGWLCSNIDALLSTFQPKIRKRIILTGFVEDQDLPVLYSGASAFCYPSLDEGFGLPIIEAMSCRTPVITSACSSMLEIGQGYSVLVDPESIESIATGIHTVLSDSARTDELRTKGSQCAAKYTWSTSAERMAVVYQTLMAL